MSSSNLIRRLWFGWYIAWVTWWSTWGPWWTWPTTTWLSHRFTTLLSGSTLLWGWCIIVVHCDHSHLNLFILFSGVTAGWTMTRGRAGACVRWDQVILDIAGGYPQLLHSPGVVWLQHESWPVVINAAGHVTLGCQQVCQEEMSLRLRVADCKRFLNKYKNYTGCPKTNIRIIQGVPKNKVKIFISSLTCSSFMAASTWPSL